MSRVVTAIVTLLAALFGPTALLAAGVTPGSHSLPAHTYDLHPQVVQAYKASSQRGPPAQADRDTTYDLDGLRWLGHVARPNDVTPRVVTYHYDGRRQCGSVVLQRSHTAAKTVDDVLPGVKAGWPSRVADNGKGTVWQAPGSTGNANMLRVMEPTEGYPNGYVRFYNQHGQPIGLNGKPGPRPDTHIPRNHDGTYDLPEGW